MEQTDEQLRQEHIPNRVLINGRAYNLSLIDDCNAQAFIDDSITEATHCITTERLRLAAMIERDEAARLHNLVSKTGTVIPPSLKGMPVVVLNNQVCPVRHICYSPTRAVGMKMAMNAEMAICTSLQSVIMRDLQGYEQMPLDTIIELTFKWNKVYPMFISIVDSEVVTSQQCFHTLSLKYEISPILKWWKLCIGNALSAVNYFKMSSSDMNRTMNTINFDSLGTHNVYYSDTPGHTSLASFLNNVTDLRARVIDRGTIWPTS